MKNASLALSYSDYRRKVFGCWLGKSIGGTLGGPWEGRTPPKELTFYDPVPTAMLENDDLDLQLVWLARIQESGMPITSTLFARGWRENIQAWPDEYGVCIRNLDQGLLPPLTGSYDNGFTAGMGAAIRTELWACIAPGDPALARRLAREDARCDHADEGVYAAEFLATIESLAFVESDRDRLIDAGLHAIPSKSRVAKAIRFVLDTWKPGVSRKSLFERLDRAHGNQNFTDVATNLAIIVLGWCVGEGDFGKSILAAVNCGYDADCTCATLGAILGLIDPDGITDEWKKPIGEKVALGGYITGIRPPETLAELTDMTSALAQETLECYNSSVRLVKAPKVRSLTPTRYPSATARALRELEVPDTASVLAEYPLHLMLDYPTFVRVAPGSTGRFRLVVTNMTKGTQKVAIELRAPLGWKLGGKTSMKTTLKPAAKITMAFTATPAECAWRPYTSSLGIVSEVNGVPNEVTAGLLMTIPLDVWTAKVGDAEPVRPTDAVAVEASSHFQDLAPFARKGKMVVAQFECKDCNTRNSRRRFVVQTSAPATVWINGEKALTHDGTWHVPALHRAEKTFVDVTASSPIRVTIAVNGVAPGVLYHAVGEPTGNCNRWLSLLEYRKHSENTPRVW